MTDFPGRRSAAGQTPLQSGGALCRPARHSVQVIQINFFWYCDLREPEANPRLFVDGFVNVTPSVRP